MRVAIRIGLLLLLGFVINAMIVVRMATWTTHQAAYEEIPESETHAIWRRELPGVEPWARARGSRGIGGAVSCTSIGADHEHTGLNWEFRVITVIDVGWPLRASRGVYHMWGGATTQQTSTSGMLVLPNRWLRLSLPGAQIGSHRLIPVRPLWGGLALNTLLYGLAAGAVGWIVMQVRRRARLDRRCCAACRYDLRASLEGEPVRCPECAAVYTISVFRRPRQVLRCWMIVYCVPPLVLGGMWLFSDSLANARETVRIKLNEPAYYFGWPTVFNTIVLTALVLVSAYSLAMRCYEDRPRSARVVLAATVSLVLTALCLPAALLLIHGLSP